MVNRAVNRFHVAISLHVQAIRRIEVSEVRAAELGIEVSHVRDVVVFLAAREEVVVRVFGHDLLIAYVVVHEGQIVVHEHRRVLRLQNGGPDADHVLEPVGGDVVFDEHALEAAH